MKKLNFLSSILCDAALSHVGGSQEDIIRAVIVAQRACQRVDHGLGGGSTFADIAGRIITSTPICTALVHRLVPGTSRSTTATMYRGQIFI